MRDNRGKEDETSSAQDAAPTTLSSQLRVVRRYWWVVALVALVAMGSAIWSTAQTPTSFTGRSSLIVSSNNRSPDQDAVLVQGYVTYFNDGAYQNRLLAKSRVDSRVTLTAQSAAASPILLVQATAGSFREAETAATAVARAFQNDINRVPRRENRTEIAQLREQLSAVTEDGGGGTLASDIQDQIQELQSDQVNMLQELQFDGGVTVNSPSMAKNALLGLVGGLLVGLVAALGAGRLRELRRSPDETAGAAAAAGTHSTVETLRAHARREQGKDGTGEAPPPSKHLRP